MANPVTLIQHDNSRFRGYQTWFKVKYISKVNVLNIENSITFLTLMWTHQSCRVEML